MEETMSLQQIVNLLRKRKKLIIGIAIVSALLAAIVSNFMLPKVYQTSAQILVNQELKSESPISNSNVTEDLQLIQTYSVIIKSSVILDSVIKELNLERSFDQLNQQITVESAQDSQVIDITVKDGDPVIAAAIANETAKILELKVEELMDVKNITIMTPAKTPENSMPIEPNPLQNIIMATVAGLILGVGIAFLLEFMDTTIKTSQEIKVLLGVPVIGNIPSITEKEIKNDIPAAAHFKRKEA